MKTCGGHAEWNVAPAQVTHWCILHRGIYLSAAFPLVSGVHTVLKELFTMHWGLWCSWKLRCILVLACRRSILHKQSHVNLLNISCPRASRGLSLLLWRAAFLVKKKKLEFYSLCTADFVLRGCVRIHRDLWLFIQVFPKKQEATGATRQCTISTTSWIGWTTQRLWTQADRDRVDCWEAWVCQWARHTTLHVLSIRCSLLCRGIWGKINKLMEGKTDAEYVYTPPEET